MPLRNVKRNSVSERNRREVEGVGSHRPSHGCSAWRPVGWSTKRQHTSPSEGEQRCPSEKQFVAQTAYGHHQPILLVQWSSCSSEASESIFLNTSSGGANQHAEWAACTQGGLRRCYGRDTRRLVGGPSVGQSFDAQTAATVTTMEERIVQLPTGSGMTDTGCRSADDVHDFHVLHQATMDSLSWPHWKGESGGIVSVRTWKAGSF